MEIGSKQFAGQFSYYTDGSRSTPLSYSYAKDLDGDGIQEVLFVALETQPNTAATYSNTSVHIFGWKNNTFQELTSQWLPNNSNLVEGVGDVAFGDFNGDGKVDVFLSAYTDMNHPVNAYQLINRGDKFEKVSLGLATWMHAVASADINRDGYDDVISAGYMGARPFVGSASGLKSYQGMVGSSGLALGDFLGDGTITAIFVDAGSGVQDTFLYRFDVNQQNQFIGFQKIGTLPGPRLAALGLETSTSTSHDIRARPMDFNGDGLLDVVVFSYLADYTQLLSQNAHKSEIQFLLNRGAGKFEDVTDQYRVGYDTTGYVGYYPQVSDFNLDGRLDIFTSSPDWMTSYNSTTLLLQQQNSTYVDTDRTLIRSNITGNKFSQEIIVSGPNQAKYLVSESAWNFSDPTTKIYIQSVSFPEREAAETLTGTALNDVIYGLGGNDVIVGKGGNDTIDGGAGVDTAVFSGKFSDYAVSVNQLSQITTTDKVIGRDGKDSFANIERFKFNDGVIAIDINGNAGQAYRLYKAALDRVPDAEGLGHWISALDRGISLQDVASGFVNSVEFRNNFYGDGSNATFITALYNNVLDRNPDAGGYAFWNQALLNGASRESILIGFSESPENNSNTIGLIGGGIVYQEWIG